MEVGKVRIVDSKEGRGRDKKVLETGETGDLAEVESALVPGAFNSHSPNLYFMLGFHHQCLFISLRSNQRD